MHWIAGSTPKAARFSCSCCGGKVYYPQPNRKRKAAEEQQHPYCPYPHCPYCGAEMDLLYYAWHETEAQTIERVTGRTGETISIEPSAAMRRIIARSLAEE